MRFILPLALFYLSAANTLDVFMREWGGQIGKAFPETVDFTAPRPFAYRALVPLTIRAISAVTPPAIKAGLLRPKAFDLGKSPYSRAELLRRRFGFGTGYEFEYLTLYALSLFALFVTQIMWWLLLLEYEAPSLIAAFAPPIAMFALPLTFAGGGYVYDCPELLLASTCLWLFVKRRWALYYLVFAIAVLNKESSVLWAAWCLALWPSGRRAFVGHLLMHVIAGGLPFILVRRWMASHSGAQVDFYLTHNLHYWVRPSSWVPFKYLYAPAVPVPVAGNLIAVAIAGVLVFYQWSRKDMLMRVALVSTTLAIAPFFLAFGFENEIRVFAASFPAFVVLATDTVCRFFGAPDGFKQSLAADRSGAP